MAVLVVSFVKTLNRALLIRSYLSQYNKILFIKFKHTVVNSLHQQEAFPRDPCKKLRTRQYVRICTLITRDNKY